MELNADTIGKWLVITGTIGGGVIALYVQLNSLTDAKNGHADVLTEQRVELRKLQDRVSDLERDREMLERVHKIEVRLGSIEELLRERKERRR